MLRYKIAALTAELYMAEGYSVVYQDVVFGSALSEVIKLHQILTGLDKAQVHAE